MGESVSRAKPIRLRLSRAKGFSLQAASLAANGLPAIKVDRSTRLGNPFVVGKDGTARECVDLYHHLMTKGFVCLTTAASMEEQRTARAYLLDHFGDLAGHNLACWCRMGQPCHGDWLLDARLVERGAG